MPIDMNLVLKGTQTSREGLLDQSLHHKGLEAKYLSALLNSGWTLANSREFLDDFDYFKARIHQVADARADSKTDRHNEQSAITEAKSFKRKLLLGFADLSVERRVLPADYDLVRKSGRLERSTPKILGYFAKIRGQVEKYDAALAPYFGGTSALSLFENVRAALEDAQGTQELNLKALPQETLKLYEVMGRLLTAIEKMNRIAKIAFDGQALVIAEFNKDLLNRARKARRSASTVEPVDNADTGEAGACETGEGEKTA